MKEMYFISVLGTLNNAMWVIFGVAAFALVILLFMFFMDEFYGKTEIIVKKVMKYCAFIIIPITLTLGILIPTKKDLYVIYGIGTVIDYVKDSDEAKQLPDKTIKMLNSLADKYTEKEEE